MRRYSAIGASCLAIVAACGAGQAYAATGAAGQDKAAQPASAPPPAENPVLPPVAEEPQNNNGLADIVITAQRREENIQRAAIAITAVTGDMLKERGVTSVEGIGRLTAGLQVTPSAGPYATFTVRGITQLSGNAFADPSVAVNINGVYVASPVSMRGLFYDLERVEVLKGPQGTLYGRNATAGAINIIPKRPTFKLGAEGGVDIGNYGRFDVNAAINLPVTDTVALRIAGQRAKRNGFFSDGTSDEDVFAARAQLLFKPVDNFSLLVSGDYAHQGGKGVGATLIRRCTATTPHLPEGHDGNCFVSSPFTAVADLPNEYTRYGFAPQSRNVFDNSRYYGLALNADWTTSIGTATFIAGYRKSDVSWRSSATSWHFIANDHPEQTSFELRLASPGENRLKYVFGAYYLNTEVHSRQNGENGATPNFSDQFNNLKGWTGALFGQLTYSLTDTFRVTGGIRYTYEKKDSDSRRYVLSTAVGPDPIIPATEPTNLTPTVLKTATSWKRVNWKAGVEFDVGPRNLLYANVSTGFKAGGFFYGAGSTVNGVLSACATSCIYQPEQVTSYVFGSKNRFFNNRLQLNFEAFYLNYTNQQISVVKLFNIGGALSSVLVTDNAGKSRNYGFEVEGEYLITPQTRFSTQIQYLNSKYLQFSYVTSTAGAPPATSACAISPPSAGQVTVNCTGRPGLRTPRWRVIAGLQQSIPLGENSGEIVAEANGRYETSYWSDVSYIPETRNYPTARLDLSLGYNAPGDRFSIKAYVDNVTNVTTIVSTSSNNSYARTRIATAGPSQLVGINLAPPRTFGVRGQFKF